MTINYHLTARGALSNLINFFPSTVWDLERYINLSPSKPWGQPGFLCESPCGEGRDCKPRRVSSTLTFRSSFMVP